MATKDEEVQRAKLAEQAERYDIIVDLNECFYFNQKSNI
jgi:hypothetical protein